MAGDKNQPPWCYSIIGRIGCGRNVRCRAVGKSAAVALTIVMATAVDLISTMVAMSVAVAVINTGGAVPL
jgi:hypothetical protein